MAFDNSYTAVTGATYQAADYNTHTKGNFTALWVGATAGDTDYYSSATAKSRLPLTVGGLMYGGASAPAWLAAGAAGSFVRSNGSAPEYGALVYRRQGGSSTSWPHPGTTTYTPSGTIIQAGALDVSVSSSEGSVAVTYPVAFAQRPLIFLSANLAKTIAWSWGLGWTDDTVSGFNLHIKFAGAYSGTVACNWVAMGA